GGDRPPARERARAPLIEVLVLYYSRHGATEALAREACRGIDSVSGASARLRTVPPVSTVSEAVEPPVPAAGPPYVTRNDRAECAGRPLGSPRRFGHLAAPLKYVHGGLGSEWASGTPAGQPAGVFPSTATLHRGQEARLLSVMVPPLPHGMLIVGIPYTEPV